MFLTRLKTVAAMLCFALLLGSGVAYVKFVRADPASPAQDADRAAQGDARPAVGARKPRLVDAGAAVEALAWSPDGKLLATRVKNWSPTPDGRSVPTGRALQIRDADTGAVQRTLYDEDDVWGVRFSPDGKSVAAALAGDNVVKLWDPQTGKEKRTFEGAKVTRLISVAFSRDGRGAA